MADPALIVIAYNRPQSLQRLLDSLAVAHYPDREVSLTISIDQSTVAEVEQAARHFNWPHGPKTVNMQDQHQGLKEHVLACGDLITEGGSAILLEDDLLVSPYFYHYAREALSAYQDEPRIGGISLYRYDFAENGLVPFSPIANDAHFIQVAASWGQAWTHQQWQDFRQWLARPEQRLETTQLPEYLRAWGPNSWKARFTEYLMWSKK
ncbi:MAG: glycosyltransferase family A protein, partial [Bacteroidota bacterium]